MRTRKRVSPFIKPKKAKPFILLLLIALCAASVIRLFSKEQSSLPLQPYASVTYASIQPIQNTTVKEVLIQVYDGEATVQMNLEEYIVQVVAGEMPVSYEMQALKAQAVAARTYTLRKALNGGCVKHKGADICTDSAHCQAFCTVERMHEKWGASFAENYEKIATAVFETTGEVLTYDNKPINALFHAASGGRTEDVVNVFSAALPYLIGVDSPGENDTSTVTYTPADLIAKITAAYPKCGVTAANIKTNIKIVSTHTSGQVSQLKIGNEIITGKQARTLFALRSANFTISIAENKITFSVNGYGHGVGLSQKGANAMAANNADYKAILTHYYTGVSFDQASSFK